MKRYADLVAEALSRVRELVPWDLRKLLEAPGTPMILNIREPAEFAQARIPGSINVPRGVLEAACDGGYEETLPELAAGGRHIGGARSTATRPKLCWPRVCARSKSRRAE